MKRHALFILSRDPASHTQPAEALRIAAALKAWRKIKISLYLHHPTALALADKLDHLNDRNLFHQCLPDIAAPHHPIFVPTGLSTRLINTTGIPHFEDITEQELATLAAHSTWVLHF